MRFKRTMWTYRNPRAKTTLRPILFAVLELSFQIIGIGSESIRISPRMSSAAMEIYAGILSPQWPLSSGSQFSANGRHMQAPIRTVISIQQRQYVRTSLAVGGTVQRSSRVCRYKSKTFDGAIDTCHLETSSKEYPH